MKWQPYSSEISRIQRSEIALGGMSRIFLWKYDTGHEEVLKELVPKFQGTPEGESCIENEFESLKALAHPLIPRVFRLNKGPGLRPEIQTRRLFMEYIPGISLRQWRDQFGPILPEDLWTEALEILTAQMICLVSFLQERKWIHGDLCPENFMVGVDGRVHLVDFATARQNGATQAAFRVQGKAFFRAPELRASGQTSLEGDIFALGRILELLLENRRGPEWIHQAQSQLVESRRLVSIPFHLAEITKLRLPSPAVPLLPAVNFQARLKTVIKKLPLVSPQARVAIFIFILIGIALTQTTWLPYRAKITINSLPHSRLLLVGHHGSYYLHTPVKDFEIPAGEWRLDFQDIKTADGRARRTLRILPGESVKVFEEF